MRLVSNYSGKTREAGCDESGRGCLAGPVFAAAVILPSDFYHPDLNDSKKMNEKQRYKMRDIVEKEALSFAVARLEVAAIDKYNILWASIRAMHKALDRLQMKPEHIIIDGNKFMPYKKISFDCMVAGDAIYASIAAASVLAKTYRDDYMLQLHKKHPHYHWDKNKGYPTEAHRKAILERGPSKYHRHSFQLYPDAVQLTLF